MRVRADAYTWQDLDKTLPFSFSSVKMEVQGGGSTWKERELSL